MIVSIGYIIYFHNTLFHFCGYTDSLRVPLFLVEMKHDFMEHSIEFKMNTLIHIPFWNNSLWHMRIFLEPRICGLQLCDYWLYPFPCAHILFYDFMAIFCSCICAPPQLRSNLEGRCSTRSEGDDDSRQLATQRRSSLVSSWWAVSLSWARHGQTAGACQLEVLQQGKRRSTEN